MGKELVRRKMMEYLKMEECHVLQIAELEKACFSDPWSENAIRSELSNPLSLWIVAVENGVVAGYVGSQSVLGESDMMNLAVLEEYRRCGVGGCLIKELVNALCREGNYQLTLEVRQSNTAAIKLYEKMGFMQVGRRPNYYHSPKEDALILRKEWEV